MARVILAAAETEVAAIMAMGVMRIARRDSMPRILRQSGGQRGGQPVEGGGALERLHERDDRFGFLRRPLRKFGVGSELVGHFVVGHRVLLTALGRLPSGRKDAAILR